MSPSARWRSAHGCAAARRLAAAGTGFAFPSQTVYVRRDEGLDAEAGRRAASAVAEWRARDELPLPAFPPERIRELDATLDYPPKGSALRRARA